jgi:hypothetical protein
MVGIGSASGDGLKGRSFRGRDIARTSTAVATAPDRPVPAQEVK